MNKKALMVFVYDCLALAAVWVFAYYLRFNFEAAAMPWMSLSKTMLVVLPVYITAFLAFRLYRGIWRYASLPDLKRIMLAVGSATIITPLIVILLRWEANLPRSVLILAPMFLLSVMCGSRLAYRMWREWRVQRKTQKHGEPVIILGAGDAANNLIKELARTHRWQAVAMLDDNPRKHGRIIQGVKVVGDIAILPGVMHRYSAQSVVLAIPSASADKKREIIDFCVSNKASIMTMPSLTEALTGHQRGQLLRKINVEDLLGRAPVRLEKDKLDVFLTNKVVMVTGAGGSIGSELCRQIAMYQPRLLVCFDVSEFALYNLREEFDRLDYKFPLATVVGDVKNHGRVEQIFNEFRPALIFHAAAYKHVPLMEDVNAWEAMRNNSYGTYVVASLAAKYNAEKFVLISTDKAVNPTNIMGASKRLAELVCQALSCGGNITTRYEVVRFGNVLGSAGSVIPKFQEQIARGGPVTITHPDIIRFFMSIPEAAQLVLQAGCMGQGGEIFVLDMGDPIRIVDLAKTMIHLAGLQNEDIEICYTGLRPGEKLYEELLADNESTIETRHPKVRIFKAKQIDELILKDIVHWLDTGAQLSDDEVRSELVRWVPEYQRPHQSIKSPLEAKLVIDKFIPSVTGQ